MNNNKQQFDEACFGVLMIVLTICFVAAWAFLVKSCLDGNLGACLLVRRV
jgi:hypothetical protein